MDCPVNVMLSAGDCGHTATPAANTTAMQVAGSRTRPHFSIVAICVFLQAAMLEKNLGCFEGPKSHSANNANVHTEPPVGILPAAYRVARMPPSPDATVTYWRPLCVYVIAVELTLEPVLNCQSVLPVSSSSAMNSPVIFPVKIWPPPVASMPAELGRPINGISHFFSPVTGLIARKWPRTSSGFIFGSLATIPVEGLPVSCGFLGGGA